MKIGIDLHGVIDRYTPEFKAIAERFRIETGVEIYIISGPSREEIRAELDELGLQEGVHYDHIASIVDFLRSRGVHMWLDWKNTWWASSEDWWSAKGLICAEVGVSMLFDDSDGYRATCEEHGVVFILVKKEKT